MDQQDRFYTALKTINAHTKGAYPPNDTFGIHVSVRKLQDLCHLCSVHSGWWKDPTTGGDLERNHGEMLALIHSEISEALEGLRKNKMDDHLPHRKSVEVELADAIIRIMDMAEALKINIAEAIVEKLAYNATRDDHKLENRKKDDGKKF